MAKDILPKNLVKLLDETQVVLTKEHPWPSPPIPTPSTPSKPVKIFNYPDVGNTVTPKYSRLEKGVQTAENIDSFISNAGFTADAVARLARNAPKVANVAKAVSTTAKIAEPVQMALWSMDAGRTLLDAEYRRQAQSGVEQVLDENKISPIKASINTTLSGMARPVSTVRGLLDAKAQIDTDQMTQDLKGQSIDRYARTSASDRDVPPINLETINRKRLLDYLDKQNNPKS